MSDVNNRMLVGSFSKWIDAKQIVGDSIDPDAIILFNNLLDRYNYAVRQYQNNNDRYSIHINTLVSKLNILKQFCPQICIYRNRLIFFQENTAPEIDNNVIQIPLGETFFDIQRSEIINNYRDLENNGISQIVIVSKSSDNVEFLIDNNPVIIDNLYSPSISSFKTRYVFDDNKVILIRNSGSTCTPAITEIDKATYDTNIVNAQISTLTNVSATFQRLTNSVMTMPNDTIVYIHIDEVSLPTVDKDLIQSIALQWWNSFKLLNTGFQGSLVINTVRNDVIDTNFATGRGDNGNISIQVSPISVHIDGYISTAAWGLMRQAYKEGQPLSIPNQDFLDYIEDKSLVVLAFQNDSDTTYTGTPCATGTFIEGTYTQPLSRYLNDYNNFVNLIRPRLRAFKGIVYSVPVITETCDNAYLLQMMASLEGRDLTPTEINNLMGTSLVNDYGAVNMQNFFYTPLANNPYNGLNQLRGLGWEGVFSKKSPFILTVQELTQEINPSLIGDRQIPITTVTNTEVDVVDRGSQIQENIRVKVRDNHFINPLFSDEATITLQYQASCEEEPVCNNVKTININHGVSYTFSQSDFFIEENVDKVKITGVTVLEGTLKFRNLTLLNSVLPIVITLDELSELTYTNEENTDTTVNIVYQTAFEDSINYCDGNTINLVKAANSNQPPTISIAPLSLEAITPGQVFNNQVLNATITYAGTGGYRVYWAQHSGPLDVTLGDTTVEDLVIGNLRHTNNYVFRLLVITEDDGFVVQEDITVPVTLTNQAPEVSATDGNVTLPTSTFTSIVTSSDFENNIVSTVWTQISGPNTATITQATNTFSNLIAGTYVFRVTVTDGGGLTDFDDINVVVSSAINVPPIVNAGVDQTISATNTLTLMGTASDSDGTITTIQWRAINNMGDTQTLITNLITSPNSLVTTVPGLTFGVYIFELSVTDSGGATVTDTVNVSVTDSPIVLARTFPQIIDENTTTVTLDMTASDADGVTLLRIANPGETGSDTEFPAGTSVVMTPQEVTLNSPYPTSVDFDVVVTGMTELGFYVFTVFYQGVGSNAISKANLLIVKNTASGQVEAVSPVTDCNTTSSSQKSFISYLGPTIENGTVIYSGDIRNRNTFFGNSGTFRGVGATYQVNQPFSTTTITNFTFQIDNSGVVFNKTTC